MNDWLRRFYPEVAVVAEFQLAYAPRGDTVTTFQTAARQFVFEYASARLDKSDPPVAFTVDDVYVVWACKTLKNWKCLVSTTLPDGMYYEVTYNGETFETYLDAYRKVDNVCLARRRPGEWVGGGVVTPSAQVSVNQPPADGNAAWRAKVPPMYTA
jgi:hypothetical protein